MALAPPYSLAASAQSAHSIRLTWHNGATYTGIYVYRSTNSSGPFSSIQWLSGSTTSWTNNGLTSSTKYYYKLIGVASGINSVFSNTASATTDDEEYTGTAYYKVLTDVISPNEVLQAGYLAALCLTELVDPLEEFLAVKLFWKELLESGSPTESLNLYKSSPFLLSESMILVARADNKLYPFRVGAPVGIYDTKDLFFGFPGMEKTLCEIRLWGAPPHAPVTVTVIVSTDSGATWKLVNSVLLDNANTSIVFPWITGEKFRIRFSAAGLHLSGYAAYALPRSKEGLKV